GPVAKRCVERARVSAADAQGPPRWYRPRGGARRRTSSYKSYRHILNGWIKRRSADVVVEAGIHALIVPGIDSRGVMVRRNPFFDDQKRVAGATLQVGNSGLAAGMEHTVEARQRVPGLSIPVCLQRRRGRGVRHRGAGT